MTAFIAAHLWQSSVVVGMAAVLVWLLRNTHARVRHAVWTVASLKFLLPFATLVAVGNQLAALPGISALSDHAADSLPGAIDLFETASQPFAFGSLPLRATAAPNTAGAFAVPAIVATLWAVGMLSVLAVWAARWMAVARLLHAATPLERGREADILARVAKKTGLRGIPLLASGGSLEPGIVGCVRPVILWPAAISARMTDEQIAAIMLHELVHVRRRDNTLAVLHMIVEAVFWFHPLVWWLGSRLIAAREEACDEEVIRLGTDPDQYAESILRTCEYVAESRLACVAGVTGADLKRRVAAIAGQRATRPGRLAVALLTSVGVACAFVPIAAGALGHAPAASIVSAATAPAFRSAAANAAIESPVVFAPPPAPTAAARRQAAPAATPTRQPPTDPAVKFEVASIKLIRETDGDGARTAAVGGPGGVPVPAGSYFRFAGAIANLIEQGYGIRRQQLLGGPEWIHEDWNNYRIEATIPDGVARTPENMRAMIRALLDERFKLVAHAEERTLPIYVLVHAREDKTLGPDLKPSDCPQQPPFSPECAPRMGMGRNAYGQNAPFERFAPMMENFLGRPIVDRTGITGPHTWNIGQFGPGGAAVTPDGPEFMEAIQDRLGLKLESDRAPVSVVVIDSIQRPIEN
jgi:uncharacterized protein (TIGR03435 family)